MKIKTNVIVSLALAAVVTYLLVRKPSKDELHAIPDLLQLDGTTVTAKDLKGKVCIVSYFQTWCSDCVKEQPELQKLQQRFGSDSLLVLMVSDEPPEKIAAFKAQFQSNLKFYHTSVSLKKDLGIKGFPTTYLLNKQSIVEDMKIEGINWYTDETIAQISSLLRQ